jgi:hypothetical protein
MTYSLDASGGNVENTRYDRGLIQTFSKEEANWGTQTQIIIKQLSFLPLVRNNIVYEIETSSTGLYNTGLGAQFT